ncbi:MAG TPA: filamentous hemagglutinin N-terminal domain-containing protein [Gammaproteobacteria bacterium]|nr:filamentous hemagglutinin N-terminal domain-containing protein [Gammaproteobacteria bacterium]
MDITRLVNVGFKLTLIASFFMWNLSMAAPSGGQVAAGSASISQAGLQTTINQTSSNAVINWQGFNTASNESVRFNQPSSSAIALNRITSGLPTSFNGSLSANGQVWIINPAGIVFGAGSTVNVAGLLATTHGIADADFMAGHYQFTLDPNFINSQVINNGTITIADTGMAALVGPMVANNGTITAYLGKVALSTGSAFVLDMYGDNLINFGTSAPIADGSVSNAGTITATGGKVYMTANTASQVVENVISMSGTIEAATATTGQHGEIILNGGTAGTTKVSGTLRARGGHIETSGHVLIIDATAVIDAAGGSWLIDPSDIAIVPGLGCTNIAACGPAYVPTANSSTIGAATISNQLSAGTNVTITTANGFIGAPLGGTITISGNIVQTATAAALTLTADNNIVISPTGSITMAGGALTATAGTGVASGSVTSSGPIVMGSGDMTLTAAGTGNVTIGSGITSGGNITMTASAGAGAVNLNAAIVQTDPTKTLSTTSAGNTNITAAISGGADSTITSGGTTFISADVTRGGGVEKFNSPVVLLTDVTLTTAGTLSFGSSVDGTTSWAQTLNMVSPSFPLFAGTVGGAKPFKLLHFVEPTFNDNTPGSSVAFLEQQLNFGSSVTFDVAGNIDIPTAIIQGSNTGQSNVFTLNAGNLVNLNAQINTVAGTELLMRSLNGSGANGVAGTGFVSVGSLVLGGSGGANISPVTKLSIVNGAGGLQAFLNTTYAPGASGLFCVNGFCIFLPPVVPPPINPIIPPIVSTPSNILNNLLGVIANNIPADTLNNIPYTQEIISPQKLIYCTAVGCNNVELIGIGTVCEVEGHVVATDRFGNIRPLVAGDMIYPGETIVTYGESQVYFISPQGVHSFVGPSQEYRM